MFDLWCRIRTLSDQIELLNEKICFKTTSEK